MSSRQLAQGLQQPGRAEEAGPLEKSVSLLESIADQGQEDPLWHYRLGYACSIWTVKRRPCPTSSGRQSWTPRTRMPLSSSASARSTSPPSSAVPRCTARRTGDTVDQHIHTYFGSSENVFHEIVSPDIHVDIYIIPPSPERNYYILMTHGMGAMP